MTSSTDFGLCFQQLRTALGKSLREFCKQNGFDPGNVSRIEKGLSSPPKKTEGLERYANALGLKEGTDSYSRFFDLAAKETGRIPGAVMRNQAAARRVTGLLQHLRGGHGHRNWVTARHLNQWADTLDARGVLPQLVRRLLHATGKQVTTPSFPALEQTQRIGFDGLVTTAEDGVFVPGGRSVWEMGVDKRPLAKADKDFDKRREQKLAFDKKSATYICVTPRSWGGKAAWAEAKTKLRVWRQVRAYDSADLEEWLELAPAVDVWLARHLGLTSDGLGDIDEYWDNLAGMTDPPLAPEVFLSSREQQAGDIEARLIGPPAVIALETTSPAEAIDFVAAVVRRAADSEVFAARAVIVEERDAWRSISRTDSRLILVAHPNLVLAPDLVAGAANRGHHVILPVTHSANTGPHTLSLPRVRRLDLEEALKRSGVREAAKLAAKAGGSVTVLKRLLAKVPVTNTPPWSVVGEASRLVPAMLAGAWEEQHDGDRAALSRLAGGGYETVEAASLRWLDAPDPPLKRIGSNWSLVSRDDSWHLMARAVTAGHLRTFREVAIEVLSENDPAFDLLPDDRWMAGTTGRVLRHTRTLRSGIAETLALLAARPDRVADPTDAAGVATDVVRAILGSADWKRWASLSDHLPLLAEAAPDVFLTAVERDLATTDPAIPKLFEQGGQSPLFSSAPQAGLLWAMEGVAWRSGDLPRVSYALARLDELLGGKKLGNGPLASLSAIYLPWYPQTSAPIDERLKVVGKLSRCHAGSGWRLLLDLLPGRMRHTTPIRRPSFQEWALTWTEGIASSDYERLVVGYSELAVEAAGACPDRQRELIGHFEHLTDTARARLIERLLSTEMSELGEASRRQISDSVREKVTRHRRYPTAHWSLDEDSLAQLELVQSHFEPDDAITKYAWLFNDIWEVLDYDEQSGEAAVMARREEALRALRRDLGWDGILSMVERVKAPGELGVVAGSCGTVKDDRSVLPELLGADSPALRKFAEGYVWGRFLAAGWVWAEKLKVKSWPPASTAAAALCLPNEPRAWAVAASGGEVAAETYWLRTARPLSEPTSEMVQDAVALLLRHGRAVQACFVIGLARHKKCDVSPALALEALEAGLTGAMADGEIEMLGVRQHYITDLFDYLQAEGSRPSSGVDISRLARLEWEYLPLLDGRPTNPDTLLAQLGADPQCFVELLVASSQPAGQRDGNRQEPSDDDRARGRNAFRLLMMWKRVPGIQGDGTVDGAALTRWVTQMRELAEQQGRLEAGDTRFGNVLAHAPKEPTDNTWPCIAVRDVIEELGSDDMENGMWVGVYNKRGAYSKTIDEGGDQERDYAATYRAWATTCQVEWPRTAALLRRIANDYESEAKRADKEVEFRLS